MSEKYLGENSTPLLINQIKENCTQKRSTLPVISVNELGNVYQYTGATSGSLVHNYFYECVSDGQDPATYTWQQVNIQPTAETPTASGTTFDNTTSGLQATNVQGAIDEVESRVDTAESDINNIEEKIPSTASDTNQLVDHDSLGTAAFKDSTDRVSPNNTALVESHSVYSAINTALSSIYTPRGEITCAELTSALLISDNIGNVYETSDSGTTTALFLQGAGVPIATGTNVGIINAGQDRILFNLMANAFDLTNYQKKNLTSAVEGATTVESALSALSTNKQAKTLDTSLTIGGVSQTTVEGALGALNTTETTDIQNVYKANGILGAKNLIPITLENLIKLNVNGTWESNVYTYNGISYTIVTDGLNITKISVQGTSSESFLILSNFDFGNQKLSTAGTVTANGYTISGGVNSKQLCQYNNTNRLTSINISNGEVISTSVDFYPMIRLASDTDSTYQPYVMTNHQLTSVTNALNTSLTNLKNTVVQNGAHNLLPLTLANLKSASTSGTWSDNVYTFNGITYTVNLDDNDNVESILVDGTSTSVSAITVGEIELDNGTYYINGTPSGASIAGYSTLIQVYNGSSWKDVYCLSQNSFTVTNRKIRAYVARIESGTAVSGVYYYPMIRLATDTDTTYTPYAMTNQQLTTEKMSYKDNSILGAHNLLENVATTTVYADGNKTITFTVKSDGSVTVDGETGSTTNRGLNLNTSVKTISGQRYILSGSPSDSNDNTFYIDAFSPDYSINVKDTGNGIEFIGNGQTLTVRVLVKLNTVVNDKTFYPMLRLATDTDTTYQPYAKTNRELTLASLKYVDIDIKDTAITTSSNGIYYSEINPNIPSTSEIVSVEWSNDGFLGWETGIFFTCYNRRVQLQSLVSRTVSHSRKIRIYYR